VEVENAMALASAHEDADGLVRKNALLEDKLVEVCQAREVAEENSRGLSDVAADAEHRWEVFAREHQKHFVELTLVQTRGSALCLAIVGPPWVRDHMFKGMQITALHQIDMARELASLQAAVSSITELTLRRSPNETFQVEVVGDLVVKFWMLEERYSRLEWPGAKIYDLLHGPPPDRV
jgi:hypothetical protein